MNTHMKIFIVEDDDALAEEIRQFLEKWGYHAIAAAQFEDIAGECAAIQPALVLMDINLPFYDGFYWCAQIRQVSEVPILFISSREHALYIHCKDGTVQECRGKLSEIEKQVCGDVFLRCHQSFLVNMYQADRLSGNELMVSGYSVPISRRYYGDVKRRYQEILFEGVE